MHACLINPKETNVQYTKKRASPIDKISKAKPAMVNGAETKGHEQELAEQYEDTETKRIQILGPLSLFQIEKTGALKTYKISSSQIRAVSCVANYFSSDPEQRSNQRCK